MSWLIWILAAIGAGDGPDEFGARIEERALQGTVQIVTEEGDQIRTGTGAIVGKLSGSVLVLTAAHVVGQFDTQNTRVHFWPHEAQSEVSSPSAVVARSDRADLLLLEVPTVKAGDVVLPICTELLLPKAPWSGLSVGCSQGMRPTCCMATVEGVADVTHPGGQAHVWVTAEESASGRSGGPLLNARGLVIGLCHGSGSGSGYYIHAREIHGLLEAVGLGLLCQGDSETKGNSARRRIELRPSLTLTSAPQWIDPADSRAEVKLTLSINVDSDQSGVFAEPVALSVAASEGVQITEIREPIFVHAPGTLQLPLTMVAALKSAKMVELLVAVKEPVEGLQVVSATAIARIEVIPPATVVTKILATAVEIGPARWVNLAKGTAEFDVMVSIRVDGPLSDRTVLGLMAPVGVRTLQLSKNVIHSGDQKIRIKVIGVVAAAPRFTSFTFDLDAQPVGAIKAQVNEPLRIDIRGPPPVRLALVPAASTSGMFVAELPKDGRTAVLHVRPVLLDAVDRGAAVDLMADLRVDAATTLFGQREIPLFEPTAISVGRKNDYAMPSFFRDAVFRSNLGVTATPTCPTVVGSIHPVVLRREAPFKRVLCGILVAVFFTVILYVPFRFLTRLSATAGPETDERPWLSNPTEAEDANCDQIQP